MHVVHSTLHHPSIFQLLAESSSLLTSVGLRKRSHAITGKPVASDASRTCRADEVSTPEMASSFRPRYRSRSAPKAAPIASEAVKINPLTRLRKALDAISAE